MSFADPGDSGASADARQARIAATAPAPLVDKMRAAKLTGERKPVTALFADVVGSTTLAERMDPEDWTQIINEAFDLMSQRDLPLRGHDRPAPGRRDARVLRRAGRA